MWIHCICWLSFPLLFYFHFISVYCAVSAFSRHFLQAFATTLLPISFTNISLSSCSQPLHWLCFGSALYELLLLSINHATIIYVFVLSTNTYAKLLAKKKQSEIQDNKKVNKKINTKVRKLITYVRPQYGAWVTK